MEQVITSKFPVPTGVGTLTWAGVLPVADNDEVVVMVEDVITVVEGIVAATDSTLDATGLGVEATSVAVPMF